MINVIQSLRNGDCDFLECCRTERDIMTTLQNIKKEPDGVEIFKKILPRLINQVSGQYLFDCIYDVIELREYTYYLLNSSRARVEELTLEQITYAMASSWGEAFILVNLDKVLSKDAYKKIKALAVIASTSNTKSKHIFNAFIYGASFENRISFVISLFKERPELLDNKDFSLNKIIFEEPFEYTQLVLEGVIEADKPKPLPQENLSKLLTSLVTNDMSQDKIMYICDVILDNYDINDVGKELSKSRNRVLLNYLVENFDRVFKSSHDWKINLLNILRGSLNISITNKYHTLTTLFNMIDIPGYDCHQIFSNIINYDLYDYLKEIIRRYYDKSVSREFKYVDHGITTYVFRVGDYVIKLGNNRYCTECPEHYRILKNEERKIITNEKGEAIFVIEVQKYIERSDKDITPQMIYELFVDLKDSGLELTDPCSLQYQTRNFAILQSTKEVEGVVSDSFRENPLVVIDVDLIYKASDPNIKYFHGKYSPGNFTMQRSIEAYEEDAEYVKRLSK